MKNRFLTLLSALMLFSAVVVLNSCSKDDEPSFDTITDEGGITLTLSWDTGGTTVQSEEDADWDLYVYDKDDDVAAYAATYGFDVLALDDLANGTYTVEAFDYDVDEAGELTIKVEGIDDNNSFTYRVDFDADNDAIEFIKITKDGNSYKIEQL